jgi:hypothetical protein
VLCCVVLCCALLYCVVLCCVVLYCTVRCVVLCCIVLYCAVLYFVVLCCVLFCCVFAIGGPTVHSVNSNELKIDTFHQNVLAPVCASHVLVFGFMLQNYSRRFNLTRLVIPVSQTCIIRHGTDFSFIRLCHLQLWNTRIYKGIFILYTLCMEGWDTRLLQACCKYRLKKLLSLLLLLFVVSLCLVNFQIYFILCYLLQYY